ncbi:MAG: alpha/beta hydrolase family protein [Verrucomicrobiota bacterium]
MEPHENAGSRWLKHGSPMPAFEIPHALSTWLEQRGILREKLQGLLGSLPARPSIPQAKLLWRQDRGDFFLEKIVFDNHAGAMVPGYVLLPKNLRTRAPAILYCHWHGGEYQNGKEELFKTSDLPEPPGPALARQGYVVLAIDAYCFGERERDVPGGDAGAMGEWTASKFNLWMGRTLWGMMLRDDLMALDYLLSRAEVDPARVGVTGMSMGSTRAWWLMALDERLRVGVGVACLTRYQDLIAAGKLAEHGIYYFVPGILNHFDTETIVSLIAPRPMLFMTGDQDAGSPVSGVRKIAQAVECVYRLYGQVENFENVVYPGVGHVYLPEMWQRTMEWLKKHLHSPPDASPGSRS